MAETYPRVVELLRREFEEKKVTKYAFCKQTGINPTSVERYLCGISEPTQPSLQKLADYFKVSVSWLRGDGDWGYEEERGIVDYYSLPDEKKWWLATSKEIEERFKDKKWLTQYADKKVKLEAMREKYRGLFSAFIAVPQKEKEDVICMLQFIKNGMDADITRRESVTKRQPE